MGVFEGVRVVLNILYGIAYEDVYPEHKGNRLIIHIKGQRELKDLDDYIPVGIEVVFDECGARA